MKLKIFISGILILFSFNFISAQKLQPDIDVISELVREKQEEIKQRVLKNLVVKNIKTTNYTTYNTMYNLLDILTTEKNKTVMTKNIITEVSNYSINFALSNYFIEKKYSDNSNIISTKYNINTLDSLIYKGVNNSTNDKTKTIQKINKTEQSLFANYVVDKLYEKLSKSDISILKTNGLFLEKDTKNRFKFGLEIDYNELGQTLRDDIDSQLDSFVANLAGINDSSYEVFNLIQSDEFDLNDLREVSKTNIENLFNLFSFSLSEFEQQVGQNSFLAKIGKLISKYVIYISYKDDPEMVFKSFKIDVESIILSFENEFFDKGITSLKDYRIGIKPFFIIGMNYGTFANNNTTILNSDGNNISQISFVGEKIGLKFVLADFDYTHSHKPLEWYKYRGTYRRWKGPVSDPLISNVYLSIYGSGILYNVVDLKSEENFDFGLIGIGAGVTFFNNLEFNISYSVPIIDKGFSYDNAFINLGFDIPIFEYIGALRNKK